MLERFLSDKRVIANYKKSGAEFGDAVSFLYIGECTNFEQLLTRWQKWEKEYARRGLRTLSIDVFIELGGYGIEPPHLGEKLREGDSSILHAVIYREQFLGKVPPSLDHSLLFRPNASLQVRTYSLPSTERQEK